ncbi:MAG: glucuronyl hydrolase [Candidatus Glassbacteria bacterium]
MRQSRFSLLPLLFSAVLVWLCRPGAAISADLVLTPELEARAIAWVDTSLRRTVEAAGESFPVCTENGEWQLADDGWTGGYFCGLLWLMYDRTKDRFWREKAEKYTWLLEHHKTDVDNSDVGILFWPSFDLGYRLTGDERLREVGMQGASSMMQRWIPSAGYIQNWGRLGDPDQKRFVIIDCLINLDHLYWASEMTWDEAYAKAATSHAERTRISHVRPDYSSCQVVEFDPDTGRKVRDFHKQGYSDESTWSRGQSWGIYGFTRACANSGDRVFLDTAIKMADWFLDHLPSDRVPYWDFSAPGIPDDARDSSAGSMAASGLIELSRLLDDPAQAQKYRKAAGEILASLTLNYLTRGQPGRPQGVLTGGTYFYQAGRGVNQANIWGDFYYLEALSRWER